MEPKPDPYGIVSGLTAMVLSVPLLAVPVMVKGMLRLTVAAINSVTCTATPAPSFTLEDETANAADGVGNGGPPTGPLSSSPPPPPHAAKSERTAAQVLARNNAGFKRRLPMPL